MSLNSFSSCRRKLPSTPSVTSTPRRRPANVWAALRMILSDGDSDRSSRAGTTRVAGAGSASRRSPSATFIASLSSIFKR